MNMELDISSIFDTTLINNDKLGTFPGGGVWSLKAAKKLLEILHPEYTEDDIKLILEKNDGEIRKAGNPSELAAALSEYIGGYVLIPIHNKYEGNVEDTLIAIMEHYEKTGEILRIIGNVEIEIKHCLAGKPGQKLEIIKQDGIILSHEKAIAQCDEKIKKLGMDAIHVGGTANAADLERAKNEEGVMLLIDQDTAEKEGLEIYDDKMGPENNFTTFAIMTSDRKLRLKKEVIGNKDFNVGAIEVNKKKGGLLTSLLPLIIMKDEIDMKRITSSLNGEKPMIGFVSSGKTLNDYNEKYKNIVEGEPKTTRALIAALIKILNNKDYQIDYNQIGPDNYIITANNKPGALVKMLILCENHNINLDSINSEIHGDKVYIFIQTKDSLDGLNSTNMPNGAKNYFSKLVEENKGEINKIMCL